MAPRNKKKKNDRLSNLSHDILVKILSRLPTIDSVRTCVLSKRWVTLWTHTTSLYFEKADFCERLNDPDRDDSEDCFQKFVSMVFSRLASPTLETFSLVTYEDSDSDGDLPILEQCCPHLVNKRLRDLYLSCQSSFPSCIFSCQTLEHLSLELFGPSEVFPNFVHLPNLQTLEIYRCDFFCEENSDISQNNIILSFPVLKKLKSIDVCWSGFQSVSFEVPLLQRLEIEHDIGNGQCLVNYNFSTNPSVRIGDSHKHPFLFYHSRSEEARMKCGLQACNFLQQSLNNINKVKHLELSATEGLFFAKESFVNFPTCNILRHLKLSKVCGEMLVVFLVKSPNLTSLTIEMEESPKLRLPSDHAKKLLEYGIVPDCISHTLKEFRIEFFGVHEDQLRLAKYILENAQNLELLSILPSLRFLCSSDEKKKNIKEQLLSYRKGFSGLIWM